MKNKKMRSILDIILIYSKGTKVNTNSSSINLPLHVSPNKDTRINAQYRMMKQILNRKTN